MEGDNVRTFVRQDAKRLGKVERYCLECSQKYNGTRTRNQWLIYTYGITEEQYEQMFAEQQGCCASSRK